jgi:hypothetical protein
MIVLIPFTQVSTQSLPAPFSLTEIARYLRHTFYVAIALIRVLFISTPNSKPILSRLGGSGQSYASVMITDYPVMDYQKPVKLYQADRKLH